MGSLSLSDTARAVLACLPPSPAQAYLPEIAEDLFGENSHASHRLVREALSELKEHVRMTEHQGAERGFHKGYGVKSDQWKAVQEELNEHGYPIHLTTDGEVLEAVEGAELVGA